jgi:hypothetical protein
MQDTLDENIQTTDSDNSNIGESFEPLENNDNSEENNNVEPENNVEEEPQQQQGKFSTLEDANKGYAELEKKLGQQSNELGELRKQAEEVAKFKEQMENMQLLEAQKNGFQDVKTYENHKEVANFVAEEYAKHIQECEFPDEMVKLLDEYRKNPSNDLLETIESQFPLETIKDVAGKNQLFKGQLEQREVQALEDEVMQSARDYLNENVTKYVEDFKNPAFAALYAEAFKAYGCDLQTDTFVNLMRAFADEVLKQHGIKNGISQENKNATDEIAGLTMGADTNKKSNGKSLLQMSGQELEDRISELI